MKTALKVLGIGVVAAIILVLAFVVWAWNNPLALYEKTTRRALAKAGLEKVSMQTPGGELVYWEGGSGPDLVFLHGAGAQAGDWSPVVSSFIGNHRLALLDLPGHGESEPAEGPLTLSNVIDGAAAFLESRAGDGPVTLVGHSMGAWVSMRVTERMPERIHRVVLINGGPLRWDAELMLTPQNRDEARELMELLRDPSSPPIPGFVLDDVVQQTNAGPIGWLSAQVPDMETHLMDGRLEQIQIPVDILWGESDRLIEVEYARRMAAQLPASRLFQIPQCGHHPANECPEQFTEQLKQVLAMDPPRPDAGEEEGGEAAQGTAGDEGSGQ